MPEPIVTDTVHGPLPLTFGGEFAITRHDEDYTLHLRDGELAVAKRLSALDVWGIRSLTGDLVMDRDRELDGEDV
jgi:hypothetical protein